MTDSLNVPTGTMTTYRRVDGEAIDEYSWVVDTEFFDHDEEPTELIEEVWQCVGRRTFTYYPPGYMKPCEACETEGEVNGIDCVPCKGEGYVTP